MAGFCMFKCMRRLTSLSKQNLSNSELQNQLIKHTSNKMFRCLFHTSREHVHQAVCRLESRGVIRLAGKDTTSFLQGLITNDVYKLLETPQTAQYAMVLNVQGRVLYDLILYNISKAEQDEAILLIDVDLAIKDEFINFLKKYKLRKKVDIADLTTELKVWALWEEANSSSDVCASFKKSATFLDPRAPNLAKRILSENENFETSCQSTEKDFRVHRYKLGIPEGIHDLPPGQCFPLESNLAIMNGDIFYLSDPTVDFQKGCYIGQELTARTYHIGVTRKRLMPIYLSCDAKVKPDTTIVTSEKGKNAGKFRYSEGNYGLGLLRLGCINEELVLSSKDEEKISVKTHIPDWWPKTAVQVNG